MNKLSGAKILFQRHIKKIPETKEITGTTPLIFAARSTQLKNYRIYGNTLEIDNIPVSVGEPVTDTQSEYFGKFAIPVTVKSKNLLPVSGIPSTIRGVSWTLDNNGTATGTRQTANENVSDFTYANNITLPAGSYIFSYADSESSPSASTYQANIIINGQNHWGTSTYQFTLNEDATLKIVLRVYPGFNGTAIFKPMIRNVSISDGTYEPYHEPSTVTVYLEQPLEMTDGEADYIDYRTQKRYNTDGTSVDVTLPPLTVIAGTNIISATTTVPPSNISIKGKIRT